MNDREIIRNFYNSGTEQEWRRIENRPEFLLTCRFREGKSYSGDAFTRAYIAQITDAEEFMCRFGLDKLHFFGQEGILSPCEEKIMACSPAVIEAWFDRSERLCEKTEYLTWSEHLMYVGRKTDG